MTFVPRLIIALCFAPILGFASFAFAGEVPNQLSNHLANQIRNSLSEKIPNADIRIPSLNKLMKLEPLNQYTKIERVRLVEDKPSGVAIFEVFGSDSKNEERSTTIQTPYEAWVKARVAVRRINPNTKLKNEDFRLAEVNVASGPIREYRNVLYPVSDEVIGQQTRQTILENQYAVTSAIEKQPDIKRGEVIRLELISGELSLTTQAQAEEPASVGDKIRVTTVKTKKQVVGRVKQDHTVEVSL